MAAEPRDPDVGDAEAVERQVRLSFDKMLESARALDDPLLRLHMLHSMQAHLQSYGHEWLAVMQSAVAWQEQAHG